MRWELNDGKEHVGPLDEEHVLRMIGEGLPEGTLVRPEGKGQWKNLRVHAPFALALEQRAASQQPPAPLGYAAPQHPPPGYGPGYGPPSHGYPAAPPSYGARPETTFLSDPGIVITSTRAIIGSAMYPMNGITSVRVMREARSVAPVLLAIGLGLFGLLAIVGEPCRIIGVFMLFGSVGCVLLYAMGADRWWVMLGTAGGEQKAVCYHREEHAQRVVGAMNQAIVTRG
jgi:hypothetical protein